MDPLLVVAVPASIVMHVSGQLLAGAAARAATRALPTHLQAHPQVREASTDPR